MGAVEKTGADYAAIEVNEGIALFTFPLSHAAASALFVLADDVIANRVKVLGVRGGRLVGFRRRNPANLLRAPGSHNCTVRVHRLIISRIARCVDRQALV